MNKHLYYIGWFCYFLGWSMVLGFTTYLAIAAGVLLIGALTWVLLPRRLNSAVVYAVTCLWCWAPLVQAVPLHVFLGGGTPVSSALDINHAVFNGSNTYLRVSSASPTGLVDAKTGTISFWFKPAADGVNYRILTIGNSSTARFSVAKGSTNVLVFQGWSSANILILDIRSTSTVLAASGWTHVKACWDLTNTSLRKIYINGASDTVNAVEYQNLTIDYVSTSPRITIGADFADTAGNILNGGIGELWFDDAYNDAIGDYYSGGKAVALGATGGLPNGTSPPIYFSNSGTGDSWSTNNGTGGSLTKFGTFTTDGNPPEFP